MIKVWKRGHNKEVLKSNLNEVLLFLRDTIEIECDTETTGLCPHLNDIQCIQFGNQFHQYLISWDKTLPGILKPYFLDNNKTFIFQNAKFDLQFLYKYNLIVTNIFDTFLAECVLTCGTLTRRDLKTICLKYLKVDISKEIRDKITTLGLTQEVISYGLDDVKYLSLVKEKQLELIRFYNLESALNLDNKFVQALAYIEFTGMAFDSKLWLQNVDENEKLEQDLLSKMNYQIVELNLREFYNYAGLFSVNPVVKDGISYETTINWTSSKQVAKLFKTLGINVTIEEDGELKESVGKSFLQNNLKAHILVELYSNFIKNRKLLSSFGRKYLDFINPVTGRIHTTYKQILNTGRMSSGNKRDNKPNLQQLPADPRYRKCFIPEANNDLIAADYSGMESVVFANKTMDDGLLDFYDNGDGDMHSFIASKCFPQELVGISVKEIKKLRPDLRQKAKGAGFAIQFGGVGFTIANNLGLSDAEGEEVYESYMNGFPGVRDYFDKVIKETMDNGYITFNDLTNRKSFFDFFDRFKLLRSKIENMDWTRYRQEKAKESILFTNTYQPLVKDYFKLKGMIERKSLNFPVQGTSADITKTAVLLLWNYILKNNYFNIVKICNVVHDELIVECPNYLTEEVSKKVKECMVKAGAYYYTRVRLDASCDVGDHWIH